MADYRDRLRPNIQLTSPDGTVFTALWRGNESSHVKKIGIFDYPGVAGSTVQDQNIKSATYPLTLQFVGPDNDLTAKQFRRTRRTRSMGGSASCSGPLEITANDIHARLATSNIRQHYRGRH